MLPFRWSLLEPEDPSVVERLVQWLNVSPALARSLALRGVQSFEQARRFFRPGQDGLFDPFLMRDMDRAARRLASAVRRSEPVLVYGDYDVDGTTATAMMYTFLKALGVPASYFVPSRYREGYGLSLAGIERAEALRARLIVALDCGITAHEEAREARRRGMELIICDHHEPGPVLPEAVAVLNPKRPDCPYPFKELTGCGVGFKLMQATLMELGLDPSWANEYLDLVAVSTASDIVPLLDENRILMRLGLEQLNAAPRPGLRALIERAGLRLGELTTQQIVYVIGPRINAAGRMGDAEVAVKLLIARSPQEAAPLAELLEGLNRQRRELDERTHEEALQLAEEELIARGYRGLVLHRPHWPLGVIGIVASRIVERFYRPTILLTTVEGVAKGSARSIDGYDLFAAIKACEGLLLQFGGHKYAAGMSLEPRNVPALRERFNAVVSETLDEALLVPELRIDAPLKLTDITPRFWKVLKQFAPYGPQNPPPLFVAEQVQVRSVPSIVGSGHLKFAVQQADGPVFEAIGFQMHEFFPIVRQAREGKPLAIVFSIEETQFNGITSLQLRLRDLRLQEKGKSLWDGAR
ncbi:MAG: single-stranded-DNA-specific exonuclease RecJ [Bacteroidota bacterium]|nr:single-stranded-DNA-specific exonuclease RecJ [Bacteroidota bacterium]MDW8136895.1 single-stranded-DNA-specific exonuclease RecJ [Bacteroidota bacterium]